MTDAAAKACGLPRQAMIVVIKENAPENVGIGGELLADRGKQNRPEVVVADAQPAPMTVPVSVSGAALEQMDRGATTGADFGVVA